MEQIIMRNGKGKEKGAFLFSFVTHVGFLLSRARHIFIYEDILYLHESIFSSFFTGLAEAYISYTKEEIGCG